MLTTEAILGVLACVDPVPVPPGYPPFLWKKADISEVYFTN